MSPSRPLKIQTAERVGSESFLDDATPRLVLSMNGEVIYANPACEIVAGIQPLKGRSLLHIASFAEPEEAFRATNAFSAQQSALFSGLRSGVHEINFARTGESIQLQFDLVRSGDGADYVIASASANDEEFSRTVENIINRPAMPEDNAAHFVEMTSDLLVVSGNNGTFETLNPQFTDRLGYTLDDLEGKGFLDLVHPDDRAAVRTAMIGLLHNESDVQTIEMECRLISNVAQILWMEWKHKKADGRIFSAGRDVTPIKKQEQALHRREQQLLEAEAIGHMGHWHWTIGSQSLRFSDEIYRIFGVTREDFAPTFDSVNAMLHRRDVGRMMQVFQRAIIEQNDHEIDFRVMRTDGAACHVRCQGRCEFDADGDVIGLYGIMQDITQSVLHERALMEAKDAAERAYSAKSQFLANMSHELRTPLNAIIGFSEMIQQQLLGPIGNDRYLDYIKGIRESGEHLLDLITDILDMSKIEAGKYELDLTNQNIAKIIRLAVHMMESRAADSKIKIATKIQDESLSMMVDRRAVMQITLNLLSNAVKFSHPNSTIEIECETRGDYAAIRVRDKGIGIPANKLATITNPFEQAANQYTRSHEGSGLGLAITKELAELHGGSIHIESTIDVGTTVTIRLPLDAAKTRRDI
ncbi:MAG: PAS domain-containing sensor histidine kinase [Micavibrio aeruginosavorus]|uniref:histidine kinase n=1 Tax=Micavibrio aeruginosavorus TaxID=349221 RepID=A0A2W5A2N1_9BACT|nr:MAG: PAS domain-containing sensor histidine kinase [Micavibrio aeruginosavorus]